MGIRDDLLGTESLVRVAIPTTRNEYMSEKPYWFRFDGEVGYIEIDRVRHMLDDFDKMKPRGALDEDAYMVLSVVSDKGEGNFGWYYSDVSV